MLKLHTPAGWSSPGQLVQSGLGMSCGILGCGFCSWKMGFISCYLRLYSRGTHLGPSPGGSSDVLVLPEDLARPL